MNFERCEASGVEGRVFESGIYGRAILTVKSRMAGKGGGQAWSPENVNSAKVRSTIYHYGCSQKVPDVIRRSRPKVETAENHRIEKVYLGVGSFPDAQTVFGWAKCTTWSSESSPEGPDDLHAVDDLSDGAETRRAPISSVRARQIRSCRGPILSEVQNSSTRSAVSTCPQRKVGEPLKIRPAITAPEVQNSSTRSAVSTCPQSSGGGCCDVVVKDKVHVKSALGLLVARLSGITTNSA
ncbi:hypothetical protein DFH08DRAFT_827831 [Mycena albidolilacea]|uniref:Uncharacterized protein n=1 Tax=Mycena albidolilacea TaxID=1033008 RepID=A0AAD6YXF7_9AGAR|nr:hypothetical protein DFH08DRAFT_827831 [Mycena albidolilacea]